MWTAVHVAAGGVLVATQLPDAGEVAAAGLIALVSAVGLVLAWLIAVRVAGNPVPTALATIAALAVVVPLVETWGKSATSADPWPGAELAAPLAQAIWPLQLVGFGLLLLTFPDAPLRRSVSLRVLGVGLVGVVLVLVSNWGTNQGDEFTGWRVPVAVAGLAFLATALVAATVDLVLRTRRAGPTGRRQSRWLLLATGCVLVLMIASWLTVPELVPAEVGYTSFLVALYLLVPAAVAVAVIRHDLFDIDRLLSDTVAVVITAVVAALVAAGSAVLVQQAVHEVAGLPTGAAAFAAALVLVPTYRWVHRWSAATFDRERTVLLAAARAFAADVHLGRRDPEEVEQVLRSVLGDPGLRVGLAVPGRTDILALDGHPVELRRDVTLRAGVAEIAVVELGRVSARQRRLAQEAARLAWSAFESARLRAGLRIALADVEASRERLNQAASTERRRLERDLHDGAQQTLVAIGMRLRSTQAGLADGSTQRADIDVAIDHLAETVVELRRISHGVRPARLDDGLGPALEDLRATVPIPFTLWIGRAAAGAVLDEAIAQTAYYVVAEAVANTLKHAHASAVTVRIDLSEGRVVVQVRDDGVGGVDPEHGCAALRDRVASLGGTLRLTSPHGGGTLVEATI